MGSNSGLDFENILQAMMESMGLAVETQVDAGRGLWKAKRADFFVLGHSEYPDGVFIEARWQDSTGTADEKLPYLVLSMQQYPAPAILVWSGPPLSAAAHWASEQVGVGALAAVMDMHAFSQWVFRAKG